MKVGVLPVGQVPSNALDCIVEGLVKIFPETTCLIIDDTLPLPDEAFEKSRKQYNSTVILGQVRVFVSKQEKFHRVLGVVDVDIFFFRFKFCFW